ncbi:WD40-repeat-containing domain protein [Radiomyces spectabilis]|uniref:WD40-repeat-containing domain protein n=1 Tax=Radiomyces spectabilis TaxID=64574 RepID=UPI00221F4CB0|nr:WD40-repeat-containing domain protein [Radiomyces spectabilis]KAI8366066.1 WD40-repeat-containing domain protein [Radiomyces spectabilis]
MQDNTTSEDEVLTLIIGQLVAYGYASVAQTVADATGATTDMMPSTKLADLIQTAKERMDVDESDDVDYQDKDYDPSEDSLEPESAGFTGLDGKSANYNKPVPEYVQLYYTQHKGPCQTAIFSTDGRFAATGSHDSSLKLLDVSKMKNRTGEASDKPVIRTLYDHTAPVNDLSFHPNGLVLASCSDDQSIKLFDLSKTGVKRAFRYLQDAQPVNSISFHPSGDFLLAGTHDAAVRIYDVKTLQCFTNSTADIHRGPITQIRYSHTGKLFATSSADGSVRIWDSVSSQCIKQLEGAHGGAAVSSVRITKNEKFLLTAGLDSSLRLWDISSGKLIMQYTGHEQRVEMLQPALTYNEAYVLMGDEASMDVFCWNTQSGELVKKIPGHNNVVRCVAASPVDNGILTCSDDYRARYFDVSKMAF